jgi:hypothetical protein
MPLSYIPRGSAAIGQGIDEAELLTAFYALGRPGKNEQRAGQSSVLRLETPGKSDSVSDPGTLAEFPRRGP